MKKHYHNITLYQKLRNDGLTWRDIGQRVGINYSTIVCWVSSHYEEHTTYEYKKSEAHLIGVERDIYEAYSNGIKKSVLALKYDVSEYTIKKVIDSEAQNPANETRNILSAHEDLKRTFNVGNKILLKAYRVIEQKLDSGDVGTTELAKIVNALASSQASLATQSTKASMLKLGTNTDTVLHNASKDIQERLKSNAESTVIDTSKY